jgi:hypothetical protein
MTEQQQSQSETAQTNTKKQARGIIEGVSEGLGSAGRSLARWIPLLTLGYIITASITDRLPLPSLTDTQTVFVLVLLVMVPILYFPVKRFIEQIYDPQKEVVVRVNTTKSAIVNWWFAGPELVEQMQMNSGRKVSFVIGNRVFHLVTEFDPEANEAEGVHIKESADWEMIYDPDVIEYHRWKNNAKWQAASRVLSILPDLGVDAENKYFQILANERADMELVDESYMDTYNEQMPSPDEVGEQIENAVEQVVQDRKESEATDNE